MEEVPIVQKNRKKRLHAVMDNEKAVEREDDEQVLLNPSPLRSRFDSMTGKTSDDADGNGKDVDLLNISRKSSIMSLEFQLMREDIETSVSFNGGLQNFSLAHLGRTLCAALFVTLDIDQSSYVAKYLGVITNAVIVLAVLSYVGETRQDKTRPLCRTTY